MPLPDVDHAWTVRVRWTGDRGAQAYARAQSFGVGAQASLHESDPAPSAIEYLLGALGGDLACGFHREASAQSIPIHGLEVSLAGRLDNVLVHLGVVGEHGHVGLTSITGTIYVNSDADETTIEALWKATLARSPLFTTLSRSAEVSISLRVVS